MPWYWTPPILTPSLPARPATISRQVPDFGDEIVVTGKVQEIDPVNLVVTYTDGVAAKYGPTVVFADRLEIHHADSAKFAIAKGNVRLEDPEGRIEAESLTLWYGPSRGPDGQLAVADRVKVEIGGMTGFAESAVIKPDRWEFLNVEATNCKRPIPLFLLKSRRVVIQPGKSGTLYRPRLQILGADLGNLPNRHFSLDRRNPGLQLPAVSFKRGAGLGISWASGFLLDDQSILTADFSSFPKDYPSYSATYAHSFLPTDISNTKIVARSDLLERFSWSYFDNIRVGSITSTRSFTNKLRNSATVQSVWNTGSSARERSEDFSKAIDIAYERSGPVGQLGINWQVRAQSIRRSDEDFIERGVASVTVQAPSISLGRGLETDVRTDFYGVGSENGGFGWARAHAGLIYQPIPQWRVGAAFIHAAEGGKADFVADRLVSKRAAHIRTDFDLGPTKISYLAKFDFDKGSWYDQEYMISQVVGCLEPFLIRRQFPNDYALGVRFRLDDFLGLLERRKQVRTKPVPQQISGPLADR